MEALLERYEVLCDAVKDFAIPGIRKFRNKLPAEPTEKQVAEFAKKLTKAEDRQKEVDEWLPKLEEKRDFMNSIKSHPLFDETKVSAEFTKSFKALEKKLEPYEWDKDTGKLIKGNPFKTHVSKINTEPLEKAWQKCLPKPRIVDANAFKTYVINADNMIAANRPIFQQKGVTDKLEEWNALKTTLGATVAETGSVDMSPMETLLNVLGTFVSKPKPQRDWDALYSEIKRRADEYHRRVDRKTYEKFELILDDYQEAHLAKNNAVLEKTYNKMNKLLPKLGTFKDTRIVERDDMLDSDEAIVNSDEEIEEEEEEEEEEASFSDSSEVLPKSKKRGRRESSLGAVLSIFSGVSPHLQTLLKVYNEEGDSSDFEQELKKIKNTFVDRYKIEIFHKDREDEPLPYLPGESIFFSEEKAQSQAKEWIEMYKLRGNYDYRVIKVPAASNG